MIDWIPELQPHEWPAGCIDDMQPELFTDCLFPLRINSGVAMTPSPIAAAHTRTKGDSRHSLKGGQRLSDASDLFIGSNRQDIAKIITEGLRITAIGGFGVYFDTELNHQKNVMIHVDHRPNRLFWIRVDGDYIYEPNDPAFFYTELGRQLEKLKA